jgi:hypothetical protein
MDRAEYQRKYQEENKEKLQAYGKEYRKKNAERLRQYEASRKMRHLTPEYRATAAAGMRRRRAENPEKTREMSRRYHQQNRDQVLPKMRKRAKHRYDTPAFRLRRYKEGAAKRGIEWRLEDKAAMAMFTMNCGYCKSSPDPINGIDRIDNARGCVTDNVLTCCSWCNWAKKTGDATKFREYLLRVATNLQPLVQSQNKNE